MNFEVLPMAAGGRMIRVGIGQNKSRWFFRIDLWFVGIRATKS